MCADDHVPDTGRRLGALPAGLYGNSVLVGVQAYLDLAPTPVGAERGGTADLPSEAPRASDHITDALISLHWLWVLEHLRYKVTLCWLTEFFMVARRNT